MFSFLLQLLVQFDNDPFELTILSTEPFDVSLLYLDAIGEFSESNIQIINRRDTRFEFIFQRV
ncbi:hypothetical protein [Selenomonas noxia]|uniref:hypothetical protein n=1 Tax=Selenomonas noxia TaxID=135083 RepID=UPI0023F50F3D|nr:hypothetical protein [Selenomonas noxia]